MSIDFSKAPEGATHYNDFGCGTLWYRCSVGAVDFWHSGIWVGSEVFYSSESLTPIPTFEPFLSVEDAPILGSEHDPATAKQASPKGAGAPILGMVLADLTNRALEGRQKYGEPLLAHNGRNPLWDAYQEALDLAMYLRQAIEESK